ncbi:MAG TPA: exosortase system-associated protein, TIGR04073 family [Chthoniobacteraceae bacterium]|nr:exosortase system-associated protein, TIGR04073 family [Chthoniobacteraceae bacterium]
MKPFFSLVLVFLFAATAFADIQDPPMNDYGPTRKLSRGLANVIFGFTEIFQNPGEQNEREGNIAAWTYGPVKGVGRFFVRMHFGFYEILTFPFPTTRSSYRVPYRSNVPWIHGGYDEFPPELGYETRWNYVRTYNGW